MKDEAPKQEWDRLQREYQEAVQTSYPNPERKACPGTDVVRDLAVRSSQFEDIEEDRHWKHVIHCAPCYREYLDLREACRSAKSSRVA